MLVDGKQIARDIISQLTKERAARVRAPRLGLVVCGADPVTDAYVRIKERTAKELGVELHKEVLAEDASTERIAVLVKEVALRVDGVVVQLPLPAGVDVASVLAAIPVGVDVDVLNPTRASGGENARNIQAPVVAAIEEIFNRMSVSARGKKAVVVGAGALVGAPAAAMLHRLGAHVTMVTTTEGSLTALQDADIVISGAGSPGLIKPEMLKSGVVLIDAGTSDLPAQDGTKIVGDADPACADVASLFTPVPGGVGPIAIAMLFKNLFTLTAGLR